MEREWFLIRISVKNPECLPDYFALAYRNIGENEYIGILIYEEMVNRTSPEPYRRFPIEYVTEVGKIEKLPSYNGD